MKLLAVVAALVVGTTCLLVGGAPASAGDVVGTKQFKKDCALELRWRYENGSVTHFIASDSGSECADYFIRSVSLTTRSGYHEVRAISEWPDTNFDPYLEELNAYAASDLDPLAYGNANVFIPSLKRCDRYQLTTDGTVSFLDSRPCTGSHFPPGVKPFKQDCSLFISIQGTRGADFLQVFDLGSECGDYVMRGIGAVTTSGMHTSAGLSDVDLDDDAEHEWISTDIPGDLAYGTVNVYLPSLSRCDRYLYGADKRVRFLELAAVRAVNAVKVIAVALLIGLAGALVGGTPTSVADAGGTKQFKQDCVLDMRWRVVDGTKPALVVTDAGSECRAYLVRSVSITTTSGFYAVSALSDYADNDPDPSLEDLRVSAASEHDHRLYGQANIYLPSLKRCDRYRMNGAGTIRFMDSRPCTGSGYPPGVKAFKQDCAVNMEDGVSKDGSYVFASDVGGECADYVLRGISIVSTAGKRISSGLSRFDGNNDPDLEVIIAGPAPAPLDYGTLNVFIPSLSRCDRFVYRHGEPLGFLDSRSCHSEAP